jgi:RNA polymerase sigma-B factor
MSISQMRPGTDAVQRTTVPSRLVDTYARTPPGSPGRAGLRTGAILAWMPMAHRLAHMYGVDRNIRDDLRQTAVLGLIKAVDRFDPSVGGDFAALAVPTIRGELKRYFRDRAFALRAPRRLHDLNLRIESAGRYITQPLGRLPTATDIAAHLEVPVAEVLEALVCAHVCRHPALSEPAGPTTGADLVDTVGVEEAGYRTVEQHLDLRRAFGALDERERTIVVLYFFHALTQAEIGRHLGVSQMHVSRLLRGALKKLRRGLGTIR